MGKAFRSTRRHLSTVLAGPRRAVRDRMPPQAGHLVLRPSSAPDSPSPTAPPSPIFRKSSVTVP